MNILFNKLKNFFTKLVKTLDGDKMGNLQDLNNFLEEDILNSRATISNGDKSFTGKELVFIDGESYIKGIKTVENRHYEAYIKGTGTVLLNGEFTISYILDGGVISGINNPSTYTYKTETFTLTNPTKTGYSFEGWTGSNGEEPSTEIIIPKGSFGNRTYIANWTVEKYTIHFDLNGATSGSVDDINNVEYGQIITLPNGENLEFYSDTNHESRTFLGWLLNSTNYDPEDIFTCPNNNVTFTAIWSANYYALDKLVETIDGYRENDAVPANDNDPQYEMGGEIADLLGSNGLYPWNNFNMNALETALAAAKAPGNRDLPNGLQSRVNMMRQNLQNALDGITLKDADKNLKIYCYHADKGFYDEYNDEFYPPCEDDQMHSYYSLKATMDAIFNANNANIPYTAESVQALRDIIYGNGFDEIGIVTQVQTGEFKMPAQGVLDEYTQAMAEAYHSTLELKEADYTEFESLITDYLPTLNGANELGLNVDYGNLESFYTMDSVDEMKSYYEEYEYALVKLKNVQQWQLEEGGDIYDALKDLIDALVPVDADYMNVFYEILGIPSGTEGFEYPAPNATNVWLPTWMEWARDNAGDISSQMDIEYLSARYTEASLMMLYRVLDSIDWYRNTFEQGDVDGSENVASYRNLIGMAIDGLKLRKYTITYKYNDGTDASFTTSSDYTYGERIGAFPTTDPRRTDYIFRGWSIDPNADPDNDILATVNDPVYENITLYAIWQLNQS